MTDAARERWRSSGVQRLVRAARCQLDGLHHAFLHDSAIRQVSTVCVALTVVAAFLPVTRIEKLLLVLLIVLVEYINSALEAAVDRISLEPHPLSKIAKDLGSVAVAISVIMAGLCWLSIAGPVFLSWLSG